MPASRLHLNGVSAPFSARLLPHIRLNLENAPPFPLSLRCRDRALGGVSRHQRLNPLRSVLEAVFIC